MRIRTEVLIDAPLDVVWRAFNDPAEITQWDASDDWRTTWASNDLRVGGLLRLRIEPRHGEAGFDFAATACFSAVLRGKDPLEHVLLLAELRGAALSLPKPIDGV